MLNGKKFLLIFAVGSLTALTAASLAFAAQSMNSTKAYDKPAFHNGTVGGAAHGYPGVRPDASGKSDGDIESAVERAVKHHKDVSVSVDEGIVKLSGEIMNEADRKEAINAAREVPGVRTVYDQMQVAGAGSQSVGEYFDDAAITTAVKSKLLMEKGFSSLDISVDTIDGVVTLTGNAKSKANADRAGALAGQAKGVKRVDNKLLIKP